MYVTIKRNLTDCAKKIQYIWNNCIHIKSLNNLRNAVNSCLMKRIIIFTFILVFWPSRVIYSSVGYISIISNYRPGNFGECLSYSVYLYIYSLAISIKLPNCYFFFFFYFNSYDYCTYCNIFNIRIDIYSVSFSFLLNAIGA